MSVKSTGPAPADAVVRAGYLKKLKTFKKKYFVLRAEAPEASARLEYYDSEKKFNSGQPPKRSIPLKTCFNINRRVDTKHKHVIALYTKDDCFCVVLESEEELEAWLKALLSLQHGEEAADGETPRPTFEHVWQVTVLNRGLGGTSFIGAHSKGQDSPIFRLCLTDKTLSLIRKDRETPHAELSLSSIRSCGSLKNYFYLEVGRSSVTGAGELWMETEDSIIAQNVHQTVFHAMSTSSSSKEELGPKSRNRSSSATESSKPIGRRQTHSGATKYHAQGTAAGGGRERCDSMPSRARTSSEGTHPIHTWAQSRSYLAPHRPQSLYVREISHSPPAESPVSPPSAACSTDSAGSSLSIDESEQWVETDTLLGRFGHSLTPDEAIAEENYDECPDSPCLPQGTSPSGYLPMAPVGSDDGYVDMSPRGRHTNMSPAASTSSVTSGTPSTDMRFAEYPLEKVSAYFTPSEEETSSTERPIRAYSVGSRPEAVKNKSRVEMSTTPENARVRAFSVGSKTRKLPTRVLPPHGPHAHPKPKSSSAPLLSSSRGLSSHNSDDPMNDLMEMDFSKPANSGYVDMSPANKAPAGYVEMRPGFHDITHTVDVSPYVDMRSGSSPVKASFSAPPQSDYVPVQPAIRASSQEYVDMDPRRAGRNDKAGARLQDARNVGASAALSAQTWRQTDYMDMNFQSKNNRSDRHNTYGTSPKIPDDSPMDGSMDYMDMGFQHNAKPATKDGYVEMSLGNRSANHHRQSSFEGNRVPSDSNEDYTNMSVGLGRKKEKKGSKKDKTRSQPIQIQTTTSSTSQFLKSSSSISPVYSSLHVGRKYSAGTPPKMYLPLSNSGSDSYSSLPRQRSRKNSRRDSKDSSSSSLATPSSSSTIFPLSLNSPSSPMKPCTVTKSPDTPSAIKIPPAIISVKYNRPSFSQDRIHCSDYTSMDFDKSKLTSTTDSDYVNYNPSIVPNPPKHSRPEPNTDYAIMRPGCFDTTRTTTVAEPKAAIPISSPSSLTTQLSSMVLGKSALSYDFGMSGSRCFIPISETRDDSRLGTLSPKPGDTAPTKTAEGEKVIENASVEDADCDSSSHGGSECLSPVAKISRPNSVNSDKIDKVGRNTSRPASVSSEVMRASLSRPGSASSELGSSASTIVGSRPASVNSDRIQLSSLGIEGQLHYASLDLAPTCEEEGNRSPRTAKSHPANVAPNETSSSTSNIVQALPETGFTYAKIDFVKSEGFKHNALPSNAKVKH